MSERLPDEGVMKYEQRLKDTETIRVYEKDGFLVLKPLSAEASALYGRQTKWCISMAWSKKNWSNFSAANIAIYIVINKNLPLNDVCYKVLCGVMDNGQRVWWDSLNNVIEKPNFIE